MSSVLKEKASNWTKQMTVNFRFISIFSLLTFIIRKISNILKLTLLQILSYRQRCAPDEYMLYSILPWFIFTLAILVASQNVLSQNGPKSNRPHFPPKTSSSSQMSPSLIIYKLILFIFLSFKFHCDLTTSGLLKKVSVLYGHLREEQQEEEDDVWCMMMML